MENLLQDMINDFRKDCDKREAPKLFRIHWDGDFFSDTYTFAWKHVILNNPDIQFWVYTRVPSAANMLKGIENLLTLIGKIKYLFCNNFSFQPSHLSYSAS